MADGTKGAKIRVLLVDDELELVKYMAKRLTKKGLDVVGVHSGPEALEQIKSSRFDVAVLDLKMPQMDGIEVLQRFQELQPLMQVIMLTGHGSLESALESGRQHAFRFLVKPYQTDKLVEAICEAHEQYIKERNAAFKEELKQINTTSYSPNEIMSLTRSLRAKYGL